MPPRRGHRPRLRSEYTSAIYCAHANETPERYPCECPINCHCRLNNCGLTPEPAPSSQWEDAEEDEPPVESTDYSECWDCAHANETPNARPCACPPRCYCRQYNCKPGGIFGEPIPQPQQATRNVRPPAKKVTIYDIAKKGL